MTTEAWRRTTLGQAMGGRQALRTGPFGSQLHASDYVTEGVPVVMPKDFAGGSIRTEGIARVSPEKAGELARFQLRSGDVLLARRGEMGRSTRIEPAQDGWLCGTGCLRLRPNGHLDAGFLTHFFRYPATVSWLADHAVGQTLPSLNVRTVRRVPMSLPPIHEQRQIAARIEAVEQAIGASRRVGDRRRRIGEGLWRRLLTHGLPEKAGITDSRRRPRDWPLKPIGSLCEMTNGYRFKASDRSTTGLPIIRIRNLNGSRDFCYFGGRPKPGWTVEAGDLLFAWAGVRGSSFGPRLWPGPRGVLNQHIFRVRPGEGVVKEWLFETLRLVTRTIEERALGFKSDLLHLRKAEILDQPVPVPPLEVQRWIAARSRSVAEIEAAELAAARALARLRDGLAHDLLSGRVRTVGP